VVVVEWNRVGRRVMEKANPRPLEAKRVLRRRIPKKGGPFTGTHWDREEQEVIMRRRMTMIVDFYYYYYY